MPVDHGVRLLAALEGEFGEELVALIDRASSFYAKDVWKFVSGEETTEFIGDTSDERVSKETLQAWYFPPRLLELNQVEQCWNQLEEWCNPLLIEDFDQLQADLRIALGELSEPNGFNSLAAADFESEWITNQLCPR